MKDPFGVLVFSIALGYFLYYSFILWMKPEQVLKDIHERRKELKARFPFIPDWFVGFIFFYEKPKLSIWWARALMTIAVLICVLGLIASFHGPF